MSKLLQNKLFASLAAVLCTLLWGTAFPFIKLGYAELNIDGGNIGSKLLFAGLRFFLAGAMTLAFLFVKERKPSLPQKSDLSPIFILGAVQTFAQYLFTYIGIGLTSGTHTSVITACASFLTVLAAPIFFRSDRLTALKLIGCALGFGGILLINGGGSDGSASLGGDALIFCSTVCAAAGNLIAKRAGKGRNPVPLTAWQLLFGGFGLTVSGLLSGGRISFSTNGALILLWLAFVSAAAFTLWTALLKHHPASKISVFNLLVPVIGTVLSGLLLGENILRLEIPLSLLLICAGIAAVNITLRPNTKLK